ncbi:hypothetical protein HPB51_001614 [Rhipicephalus microplus]|uniref:SWIM-type domain-containing protein n=1 Tax=Rhipicephalus microplus TaxID=6941 RepID=A0A9J6EQX4_RHIMP|nr:hypothetical protein HPB51_001614 [Rhipicephalus microplus]
MLLQLPNSPEWIYEIIRSVVHEEMKKMYGTRQIYVGYITSTIRDEVQQVLHAHRFPPRSFDPETAPVYTDSHRPDFKNQAPTSSKQQTKSYAFAMEAYTLPSSVVTNVCDTSLGIVYVHATCYRSQKKSGRPYKVCLALKSDSGAVADSTCERPAGGGGACSHILVALHVHVLLKQKGFKEATRAFMHRVATAIEAPPTTRHQAHGRAERGLAEAAGGWHGHADAVATFDARAEEEKEQQHLEAVHSLVEDLQSLGTSDFAAILLAAGWPSVNSKLGPAPAGSALSYQQAKLPAGFATWMSPGIMQGAATVTSVPALTLFSDGASQPPLPSSFAAEECRVLTEKRRTDGTAVFRRKLWPFATLGIKSDYLKCFEQTFVDLSRLDIPGVHPS